jgi:hypothetical protein
MKSQFQNVGYEIVASDDGLAGVVASDWCNPVNRCDYRGSDCWRVVDSGLSVRYRDFTRITDGDRTGSAIESVTETDQSANADISDFRGASVAPFDSCAVRRYCSVDAHTRRFILYQFATGQLLAGLRRDVNGIRDNRAGNEGTDGISFRLLVVTLDGQINIAGRNSAVPCVSGHLAVLDMSHAVGFGARLLHRKTDSTRTGFCTNRTGYDHHASQQFR